MTTTHANWTLLRTGQPPLAFRGEEVAFASGKPEPARHNARWHDLSVFRTGGGQYILYVQYHTNWKKEFGHSDAQAFDTLADLAAGLDRVDPVAHLIGFPPGERWEADQRRVEQLLIAKFAATASAIYDQLGEAAVERLD